jgi:Fe-S-cluster-containing dehydrogenase component/formate-dependent nitrite reductase membrane component NrfD
VRYGFVIDHNRCIGCHACTVACKEENNVPIGVFRTWVKYIEKGEFPATSRHFGVMRCNHCEAAPCVEICPTNALLRRDNGIVDFDNSRCIGCKSCMQACPYDALYIDPETHTAAKCNFCAHRIELNLEPACVVVCPTRAIITGDLDDAQSPISQIVATQKVAVRKPYKGTEPKLFYTGIEGDFLQPSMMQPAASHLFAERDPAANPHTLAQAQNGAPPAPGTARVVYDVAHPQPWGMIPAFYLWTKSIAAGLLIVTAIVFGILSDRVVYHSGILAGVLSPAAAILFTAITAILLIADLDRPDRFYYILLKPNPRSWLVWGTWILIAYGILGAIWLAYGLFAGRVPRAVLALSAVTGAATACYSAFLFAQAKGRDLWQSPLFLWHLLSQAFTAGAAALILLIVASGHPRFTAAGGGREVIRVLDGVLLLAVILGTLMILSEVFLPSFTDDAHRAIEVMTRGKLQSGLLYGVMLVGAFIPIVLLYFVLETRPLDVGFDELAAILALLGLLIFDELWITAGQAPPLS